MTNAEFAIFICQIAEFAVLVLGLDLEEEPAKNVSSAYICLSNLAMKCWKSEGSQLKEKKTQAVHARDVFHYKSEVGISTFLAVYVIRSVP